MDKEELIEDNYQEDKDESPAEEVDRESTGSGESTEWADTNMESKGSKLSGSTSKVHVSFQLASFQGLYCR